MKTNYFFLVSWENKLTRTLASVRFVHIAISSLVLMSGYRFLAKVASSSCNCWEVKCVRWRRWRFLFCLFFSSISSPAERAGSSFIFEPVVGGPGLELPVGDADVGVISAVWWVGCCCCWWSKWWCEVDDAWWKEGWEWWWWEEWWLVLFAEETRKFKLSVSRDKSVISLICLMFQNERNKYIIWREAVALKNVCMQLYDHVSIKMIHGSWQDKKDSSPKRVRGGA